MGEVCWLPMLRTFKSAVREGLVLDNFCTHTKWIAPYRFTPYFEVLDNMYLLSCQQLLPCTSILHDTAPTTSSSNSGLAGRVLSIPVQTFRWEWCAPVKLMSHSLPKAHHVRFLVIFSLGHMTLSQYRLFRDAL